MDIDLGQDVSFKVTYNGSVYMLREPSVKEVMGLKDMDAQDQNAILSFMDNLGLPVAVSEKMPISKVKRLIDTLVGAISEKK